MTIKVSYTYASPVYINIGYGTVDGGAVWGDIVGTLSNQADLQNALNAKFDDPTGTTAQYIRGDGSLATFPTLTGFVPYTGATTNVNLGEFEVKAGQVTLDTTPTGTAAVATTRWNDTTGLTETTLKGGNVVLKNGVDLVARVVNKVTPNTTLTKAAYQAVRVSGAQGQRLAVAFAQANNDNNSADTIGLVTETIATNQEGFIMTVGQLEGINTTGSLQGETWVDGDVLYLSPTTAGALTNVKPIAPQHLVIIGYVEYAHANNGKIYVKVMNGWELGELHDVNTTGATNGSVLKYNGSIWVPSSDIDTGITTLNTLTALSQSFATGTSGTDFNISSATSTHTFNLPSASATNRGLLTSADWTTFNNKQNALTNPVTGTGTSGQVAYFTGATTQTGSNNLFWDATNSRLGIGTNAPASSLHVLSTATIPARFISSGTTTQVILDNTNANLWGSNIDVRVNGNTQFNFGTLGSLLGNTTYDATVYARAGNGFRVNVNNSATTSFFVNSAGNTLVNSTSDNGLRFQVTGDGYFSGSVGIGSSSLTGFSLRVNKVITGAVTSYGVRSDGIVQSDVSGQAIGYDSSLGTQAAAFTLPVLSHYRADQSTFGAGSAVTTQYGFQVRSNLIGATNNYGFFGDIASGTGRWNLYMNGTAANYLNGQLLIGTTTTSSFPLDVNGAIRSSGLITAATEFRLNNQSFTRVAIADTGGGFAGGYNLALSSGITPIHDSTGAISGIHYRSPGTIQFYTGGSQAAGTTATERMRLDASGNLGIGAAPVYKFDVQGTTNTVAIRAASNTSNDILYYGTSTVTGNTYAFLTAINATGNAMMSLQNNNTVSGNALIEAVVQSTSTGDPYIGFTVSGVTNWSLGIDNSDSDKLKLGPVSNPSNSSTALVAHTNGNIGLSTATDAGFRLDVNGTMRVSGNATFGTNTLFVDNGSTRVGIGTTAPDAKLMITGSLGNFRVLDSGAEVYFTRNGNNDIIASSGASAGITIGGQNYVRIGTGSPVTQRLEINSTGAATFSSSVTSTQFRLSALNTAPATASSTGTLGEIRIDADYIYICTATNTWKRVAIATW